MRYYRCKCGDSVAYGSMPPYPCSKCDKCGSDLASHPGYHSDPKPHDWQETKVQTDAGDMVLTRCGWCGMKKADFDIAADNQNGDV